MSKFQLETTSLAGLMLIKRKPINDDRGFFERVFCDHELGEASFCIRQVNRSLTHKVGSIRGMHFQNPPYAEAKIVSCVKGKVFDVAIDLRNSSPTFLKWHGEILSSANHHSLYIPKGFAHGFQTLEQDCELLYLHDQNYAKEFEGQIHPMEEAVSIDWPLGVSEISERDSSAQKLGSEFRGISL